jgi:hypothetical protein
MEHLGEGIAAHMRKVGYFVKDQYDFKGFHSFPARSGWLLNRDGQWCHAREESSSAVAKGWKLSGFLQAWLFFGLLAEVLGLVDSSQFGEFLEKDDFRKPVITTATLQQHVEDWTNRITRLGRASTPEFLKAQLAMDKAHDLVSKYCSVKTYDKGQSWEADPMVTLSLLVLGETLDHAITVTSQLMRFTMNGWHVKSERRWGYSRAVFTKMIHDQWCRHSLSILQGVLQNSTIGMIYAMRLSHPKSLGLNHRLCDPFVCNARGHEFRSRGNHEEGIDCHCRFLGPNLNDLNQHLLLDKRVLLQYQRETSSIRLVKYKKGMRYAIFSHVWADGFGNESANSLPKCWLDLFSEILKQADRLPHIEQGLCLDALQYFWIDTLTVPTGKEHRDARRMALQEMHRVYASATCTIVLDAGLMSERTTGAKAVETAMRITMSQWVTRLWTLQEAYLSKRIYFYFADGLMDMDDLESKRQFNPISPLSSSAHTYHEAILGPERLELLKRRATSHENIARRLNLDFMVALWNAMQCRTVSRPQDETLAMAILLDLDTTPFDNCDLEEEPEMDRELKMARLLSLVNEKSTRSIPGNLIFLPGPRLLQPGFRWAPLTWLHQRDQSPQIITRQHGGGQILQEGLSVRNPGFRLHCGNVQAIPDAKNFLFPADNSLISWFTIQDVDAGFEQIAGESRDISILMPPGFHAQKENIGLMIGVTPRHGDVLHGHILKRVRVRAEDNIDLINQARQELLEDPLNAVFGEILRPEQEWCLDGPGCNPQQTSSEDLQRHYLFRAFTFEWPGTFQWPRTRFHQPK